MQPFLLVLHMLPTLKSNVSSTNYPVTALKGEVDTPDDNVLMPWVTCLQDNKAGIVLP